MCWQALLLTAAGTMAQKKAQSDLRGDQERIAAEGILRQAAMNREADQRVSQTVQQVATSNPDAERAAKRATYTDALRKSLGTRSGAVPVAGNVSNRFAADADSAKAQTEAEAMQNADMTATIEAPAYQRMNEGVAINNAGVDLSRINSRSAGQDYLTKLRIAMQKPNSWLQAGGELAGGLGTAMGTSAGWGADEGSAMDVFGVPTGSAKKVGSVRNARIPGRSLEGVNA